ncbi:PREDICTED: uncharacterized protein LOC107069177 [Polistes dominula]|uniref:Uncharacterized protein LOC107069177 n=1 Tax=Polistes dominula TaxID=743375 RepID=A0ABM1INE8_POLDO|nr:PREDICTED: uncharacterized protein LOC107069177 [Polistes dominula]XP_015181734.1 PREDICTED: uncharacterized protein LOC107069177 [Polistes dominula]XP_015181735.1 PREDICTED: uncharacterized protein LOC107069177 [Polistes dominula]
MFLLILLSCCSIVPILSEKTLLNQNELKERASAQLQRLAPYRRSIDRTGSDPPPSSSEMPIIEQKGTLEKSKEQEEQRIAMQILEMIEKSDEFKKAVGSMKKIDDNKLRIDFETDPKYAELLQEQDRIKRSGSGGFVTGSSSIISGIASGIIGGLASASGAASRGSSGSSGQPTHVVYGPPVQPYGEKTFDVWDFKKAILNTVIQALKAISGGVLALKGQLIKGGGFLVSTKGKIISSTGDAISSLGRHIAASAVVQPPKVQYGPPSYGYDHRPIEHDSTYDGPPPQVEDYSGPANHFDGHFPSASDDDDRSGPLLVKPMKTEQNDQNDKDHQLELDLRHPNLQDLENSFGGPQMGSNEQELQNSGYSSNDNKNNLGSSSIYPGKPQPTFNSEQVIYTKDQIYQLDEEKKLPQIYPNSLEAQKIEPGFSSNLATQQLSIQQSLEYPTIHLQQIQYSFPEKDLSIPTYNDLSSLHTNLPLATPQFDTLKISMLEHQKGLELPKLQAQDFNALPTFSSVHIDIAAQEPLTLPLLNPINAHYWPKRSALQPAIHFPNRNIIWKRSSIQRKRLTARSSPSFHDRRSFRV